MDKLGDKNYSIGNHSQKLFSPYAALVAFAVIQLATALLAFRYGFEVVFLPLLGVAGAVCFLWPRIGLVILVGSWFLRIEVLGVPGLYPADVVMLVLAAGYVLRQLVMGQRVVPASPLILPVVLFMIAYSLSLINAVDVPVGVKSWFRHLQLFALFVVVIGVSDKSIIKTSLRWFIVVCAVISIFNIATFVQMGGRERVFGPAGVLFSGYLALGGTLAVSLALLDRRFWGQTFWWAIVMLFTLAQLANQSRGAMIQLLSGIIFVLIVAWVMERRFNLDVIRRRIRNAAVAITFASFVVALAMGPELHRVIDRFSSQSGSELLTLRLREFLWGAALQLFVDHPLIGVGPAQSIRIVSYLPELKFNPTEPHVRGLSVHNSALQYLAESGVIGSICLAFFLWRALATGRTFLARAHSLEDLKWELGLWGMVFVIVSRYLYEGHLFYSISGMTTVVLIGFLVVAARNLETVAAPPT